MDFGHVGLNEAIFEEEVFGWIARQGQLREDREVRSLLLGHSPPLLDEGGVAFEVTDLGVDLTNCDTENAHDEEVTALIERCLSLLD